MIHKFNHLVSPRWLLAAGAFTVSAALSSLRPSPADAASFNCQHAALPAEVAICGNPNLSHLDEQVAGMYFLIVSSGQAATASQVKTAQGKFLTRRNACEGNIDCLVSAYTDQIMYLKNIKGNLRL